METDDGEIKVRTLIQRSAALAIVVILMAAAAHSSAYAQAAELAPQPKRAAKRAAKSAQTSILEAKQLLANLGYWVGPMDSKMDLATRDAVMAFQKVEGRKITGQLTPSEIEAIRGASRPQPLEGGPAHVEADLTRQVLFVVDDNGVVAKILPISSGSGEAFTSEGWTRRAVTPTGRFKIYRKVEGWRKAPLGNIYYPDYFLNGVAIHGSPSVPAYAASHGCIRIPVFAAKELSAMLPVGTVVIVHEHDVVAQGK